MEYKITSGKQFYCRAYFKDDPDYTIEMHTENPLVNVLNPNEKLLKIEEAENYLREKGGGGAEDAHVFAEIARMYSELGQYEKAINYLKVALSKLNKGDSQILNLMGVYYQQLKDFKRAERAFKEAMNIKDWDGPFFNYALMLYNRGRIKESIEVIDEAFEVFAETGPFLALKAMCLKSMGNFKGHLETLRKAREKFEEKYFLSQWELSWFEYVAKGLNDKKLLEEIKNKQLGESKIDLSFEASVRPKVES